MTRSLFKPSYIAPNGCHRYEMSISQMTMDFFPFKYICCSFLTDKLLTSMFSLYNVQCLIINRNCSLSSTWFTRSVLSGTETDGTDPWRAHGSPAVFYQEQELILREHMVHPQCFIRNRNWSFASKWFTRNVLSGKELILREHMVHTQCFCGIRGFFCCLSCGFVIIVFVLGRMSFCFLCRSFK